MSHFKSPLDGFPYGRAIVPLEIRYVLYLDQNFLQDAKLVSPDSSRYDVANTLFLGSAPADPHTLPALVIGQARYFLMGHRVWEHRIRAHLMKKFSWVSIASAALGTTTSNYITDLERKVDWIGSFNLIWRRGGLNALREPLTLKDFKSHDAQVWRFSRKGKIYG